jgi:hypothetical protein
MYMQRTTSGAAGSSLYATIKYMRRASGIGMDTAIKHLRRTTSGAAGNGWSATMKNLRRTTSAAANNGLSTTATLPRTAASFEVNSEPHTEARPSVRLCVGPELVRCVNKYLYHWFRSGTSTSTANTGASTAIPEVAMLLSTAVFDSTLILSDVSALGVSLGSIELRTARISSS